MKNYNYLNGVELFNSIKHDLNKNKFSKLEKAYMIGGIIAGGAGAIWGTKEILDIFVDKDWISWASSIGGNILTSAFYYPISPLFWGAGIGKAIGDIPAYFSMHKRKKLEKIAREKESENKY